MPPSLLPHDVSAGAVLTVDLAALRSNYRLIRDRVGPADVAAVVKANAYGLGAVHVATALLKEGCRDFFVAHLSEARELRSHLPPAAALYVLNGLQPEAEAEAVALGVRPVLNSLAQLDAWASAGARLGRRLPAALQVDTGMSRLGLSAGDIEELLQRQSTLDQIELVLLMSHLACADEPDHPANADQLTTFDKFAALFPATRLCFANSGGAFLGHPFHGDLVRPGIALYGVNPVSGSTRPLRPVVRLDARVIQVREIAEGAGVGYGLTFRASARTRLATIGIGYADGWPRCLSGRGAAYARGIRLPIVGRISMDSTVVDISALPQDTLCPGDLIEMIGPTQSLGDVARDAGTIAYEILTSIGQRYERVYLDDEAEQPSCLTRIA
ncbi:alanine racemase [Bradyrhizobium erythrophlei]|uniref:alanine racemase n=1 Tax=Bradyrhizobium erythrophlei TaxID=1437360 RepID=UPI0035E977D3